MKQIRSGYESGRFKIKMKVRAKKALLFARLHGRCYADETAIKKQFQRTT